MESDSEENNETISGDNKNINESSSNIEINDVQASHTDHHHPPLTQEIPIVPQNNIEVGNNESDEVVVEAKRRRKSPPVQIRYSVGHLKSTM